MPGRIVILTILLTLIAIPAAIAEGNGDDAFTVWLIVFNNPGQCSAPGCGEDDIIDDPVTPATCVAYFTGGRVQSNGRAAFAASYGEGSTVGALFTFGASCLDDADEAEVHLVVRTHSRYDPEIADEQITTFEGGCDVQPCADLQAAVFVPGANHLTVPVVSFPDFAVVPGAWATIWREDDGIRAALHTRVP